ncbi:ferredoxin-NADP reductase [Microbacterium endophyticum]|uniref:Ferredoxin-NADP reductase n=1 Tax=Microbacterium endophyticum TaxID=1526412 RepID=A0A7W4V175_9MICO|nr:FAD-dependent oxidoreductase [Microbacterium endophyticum]MBB2974879.1 ferredoxin-NADP reductase [Microbacterium endophyticum]NIK37176.1 ferredoxin-NADP reductase [Microbacterium endophyticum]
MRTALVSSWNRVYAALGRISMYRLVLIALGLLAIIAFGGSFFELVVPAPLEMLATLAVLSIICVGVDAAAQRILRLPQRIESSLITALILLFVLRPTLDPAALLGIALAALVASASKYLLVWRGRHIFNPAATGAASLTILSSFLPFEVGLGSAAWWVGTPVLFGPVVLLGMLVLARIEKLAVVAMFFVVATVVSFGRVAYQLQDAGLAFDVGAQLSQIVTASPFLFLGAFMLSEPLTMPPRRWQQYTVAIVVGVLAGWPISVGAFTLGQERALLIGNLVAFAFCLRHAIRLTLVARDMPTSTSHELIFRTRRPLTFAAGQYLELDVPHRRPDARGTRREFSIVSAPADLPEVRVAYRDGTGPQSTYKRALGEVEPGDALAVTGVWGDFVLPRDASRPLLMVAAGIGVTPFISQLRQMRLAGPRRDVVLVYVARTGAELAFRDELKAAGIPVIIYSADQPADLPAAWQWTGGKRLDAASLEIAVPDLAARHAFISGPPALIADLAPALRKARGLTTDAFSGY